MTDAEKTEGSLKKEPSGPTEFVDNFMSERQKKLTLANGATRTLQERAIQFLKNPNEKIQAALDESIEETFSLSLELLIDVTAQPVDLIQMDGIHNTQDRMLAFYVQMQEIMVEHDTKRQVEMILNNLKLIRL